MKRFLILAMLCLSAPALGAVTTTSTRIDYTAGGGSSFNFTFPCTSKDWIEVYVSGAKLTSGYTILLNANQTTSPGGSVTITPAPAAGVLVRIQRTLPLTQTTVLSPYSPFPAKTVEGTHDKSTYQIQQLQRGLDDIAAGNLPGGGSLYSAGDGLKLTSNVFAFNESGLTTNQVYAWSGTAWTPRTINIYAATGGVRMSGTTFSLDPTGYSSGQVISYNGSAWAPKTIQTYTALTGGGLMANVAGSLTTFKIDPTGYSNGQVVSWNGSTWVPKTIPVYSGGNGVEIYNNTASLTPCDADGDRWVWDGNGAQWVCDTLRRGRCSDSMGAIAAMTCAELTCSTEASNADSVIATITDSKDEMLFLQRAWADTNTVKFRICNLAHELASLAQPITVSWKIERMP